MDSDAHWETEGGDEDGEASWNEAIKGDTLY